MHHLMRLKNGFASHANWGKLNSSSSLSSKTCTNETIAFCMNGPRLSHNFVETERNLFCILTLARWHVLRVKTL